LIDGGSALFLFIFLVPWLHPHPFTNTHVYCIIFKTDIPFLKKKKKKKIWVLQPGTAGFFKTECRVKKQIKGKILWEIKIWKILVLKPGLWMSQIRPF
jgi:hypothetical protein